MLAYTIHEKGLCMRRENGRVVPTEIASASPSPTKSSPKKITLPVAAHGVVPRLFNVKEAAHYLGTSVWTVRQLGYERKLPGIKLGHKILFDRVDLDAFVQRMKVQA